MANMNNPSAVSNLPTSNDNCSTPYRTQFLNETTKDSLNAEIASQSPSMVRPNGNPTNSNPTLAGNCNDTTEGNNQVTMPLGPPPLPSDGIDSSGYPLLPGIATDDSGLAAMTSMPLGPPPLPSDGHDSPGYPTFPGICNDATDGSGLAAMTSMPLGPPTLPPDGNDSSGYPTFPGIFNDATKGIGQAAMTLSTLGPPTLPPDGNVTPAYPLPYPDSSYPNQPMNSQQFTITPQPLDPAILPPDGNGAPVYSLPYPDSSYPNQPMNPQQFTITPQPLDPAMLPTDAALAYPPIPGNLYPNYHQMSQSNQYLITSCNEEANETVTFMSRVRSNTIKKTEDETEATCLDNLIVALLLISIPLCIPCWLGLWIWHSYHDNDDKDN